MPTELFGLTQKPILLAQAGSSVLPTLENYELVDVVKEAIAWSIIAAAILCIVFIFIGGISFILSGGQDDKIKSAVATIRYAIVGLVITILAVTMVNLVAFIFKVPFDFVSYSEIVDRVRSLGEFFQGGDSFDDSDFNF